MMMSTGVSYKMDTSSADASLTAESDVPLALIIESRPLMRPLIEGFIVSRAQMRVVPAPSIKEWLRLGQSAEPAVILLSIPDGGRLPGSLSELMIPAHD